MLASTSQFLQYYWVFLDFGETGCADNKRLIFEACGGYLASRSSYRVKYPYKVKYIQSTVTRFTALRQLLFLKIVVLANMTNRLDDAYLDWRNNPTHETLLDLFLAMRLYASTITSNLPDADELAHEATIRAGCSLNEFQGDQPFHSWFDGILEILFFEEMLER